MTSKKQLRQEKDEIEQRALNHQDQLYLVRRWACAMMELHQPKITRVIDVSTTDTDEMRDTFLRSLDQELFCLEGCGRWPCKEIDRLRALRNMTDLYSYSRTSALDAIDKIERKAGHPIIETAI